MAVETKPSQDTISYYFKVAAGASEPVGLYRMTLSPDSLYEEEWFPDGWHGAAPRLMNWVLDGETTLDQVTEDEVKKWFPDARLDDPPGQPAAQVEAAAAREDRIAAAVARRRAELGGPGSGPRAGQPHPGAPVGPGTGGGPGSGPSPQQAPEAPPVGAGRLVEAIRGKGGITVHPVTGYEPDKGFAVSMDGHSSITPTKDFFAGPPGQEAGRQIVKDWLREKRDVFKDPNMHIGGWIDTIHDEVVLDPSQVVPDQAAAEKLGAERDQQSIFDLASGQEIPVGGTGGRPQ